MNRARLRLAIVLIALGASSVACARHAPAALIRAGATYSAPAPLPPLQPSAYTLDEVLVRRRSTYEFRPDPVALADIGQLLWAGQGITSDDGKRTAPSAGALYPLELYVLTDASIMHYVPQGHRVETRPAPPWRSELPRAAAGQAVTGRAPAVIVVAAVPARTRVKYGAQADAFVQREAGHATQNVLLEATARRIAAVPVGGIDGAAVVRLLALAPDEEVLYLVPIGYAP
jgi:SagB-type dehydrogenase family enzyme